MLMKFLVFLLVISAVTFVHEYGHFIVARLCGIKVSDFAIGFGKEIFGYTSKSGCRWKFCCIPMGGYVKLAGDNYLKDDSQSKYGDFDFASWWKKIAVVAAGPVANFLFSFLLFCYLFSAGSLEQLLPVVGSVMADSPAESSGIKAGDRILSVNGHKIKFFSDMKNEITQSDSLDIEIERDSKRITVSVLPRQDANGKVVGIAADKSLIVRSHLSGIQVINASWSSMWHVIKMPVQAISKMFSSKSDRQELGSVISIARATGQMLDIGVIALLWFVAALSINLGVINLLPFLPLDGGRIVIVLVDSLIKNNGIADYIKRGFMALGMTLVIGVMVIAMGNDIKQLIS